MRSIPPGASLTEYLLTSPDAFGIETATPAQRAVCRILDGVPLAELAEHPDVAALVGGLEAVRLLPSEQHEKTIELCLLAAIRCGKSIMALAAAVRMALTVDVSGVADAETVAVPIVSLTEKLAGKIFRMLSGTIAASRKLSALVVGEPKAASITLRHPSGREVEISVAAGKKAGGSLIGIWLAGVIFDEAPRLDGADDAVVNLDDSRTAVIGRLLPGAQVLYVGSPWAPRGPVYDMVRVDWAAPRKARVILRGTGPLLNPVLYTPEHCDAVRLSSEAAYQTEVLGEFADTDGGLFNPDALKRNTRAIAGDLPYEIRGEYYAAMDPSDGGTESNPWTLVVVQRRRRAAGVLTPEGLPQLNSDGSQATQLANTFRVVACREWRGARPGAVVEEAAKLCKSYGLRKATTDQYAGQALVDLAQQHQFVLDVVPWTGPRKLQAFTDLATLLDTDAVELPPDPQMQRDLASVRKRTTQQSASIVFPHMGDGRHCDYAPALASAVEAGNAPEPVTSAYSAIRGYRTGMPRPRQ